MKKIYVYLYFSLLLCFNTQAQTISSKIMDAKLVVATGQLSVYLTDTMGISGVEISVGIVPDSFSVYSQQFTVSGNSFGTGTISDNTLNTTIPGLSSGTEYYTRIRILLDNAQYNEIEIHTSN